MSEGLVWLIIMGSGFDYWAYWHFFTIAVSYTAHTLNSFWMPYLDWSLLLISVHECTAFYSCLGALIEITSSKGSIIVFYECVILETPLCLAACFLATTCLLLFVLEGTCVAVSFVGACCYHRWVKLAAAAHWWRSSWLQLLVVNLPF
jgi:hypothetical protein